MIDLPRGCLDYLHSYQKRAITSNARFRWSNWARQVGKSTAYTLRRLLRGIARRRDQIFLSAGERQSRELMLKATNHLRALNHVFTQSEHNLFEGADYKQLEITIPKAGMRIIGLPANPLTARGFTGDVFLDEFAMHVYDREIWGAILPTVLRNDGEVDVCSTPKGQHNMFYRLQKNTIFEHDTLTIHDAIVEGLTVDVAAMQTAMADDELWRQECLCEFVDEATAFLSYEMIATCVDASLPSELDIEKLRYHQGDVVIGVDIGRKHDLTVIWPFADDGRVLTSLGLIELSNIPFRDQIAILHDVLSCPCVRRCCIDESGLGMQMAEQAVEQFGPHAVEACTFTARFKEEIAGQLRWRFEDRGIRIPDDAKLRNDLHSVQRSITTAGNVRLWAPREEGSHADRFYAAALACHAAGTSSGPIEGISGPRLISAGMTMCDAESGERGVLI